MDEVERQHFFGKNVLGEKFQARVCCGGESFAGMPAPMTGSAA